MQKQINLTALLIIFALLTNACSSEKTEPSATQSSNPNQTEVDKAPEFEVTTIDGETISLKQTMAENKPMVVYFTASWCPVCAKNWPVLSKLYPEYKDQLNMVAIGIDPTDDEEVMRKLAKEEGLTFPLTKGQPDIMMAFDVDAQATTVGVNPDGTIAFRKNKTALSEEEYRTLFDELIN